MNELVKLDRTSYHIGLFSGWVAARYYEGHIKKKDMLALLENLEQNGFEFQGSVLNLIKKKINE